ncbi:MAG: LON peptidase substrate-binding domain-containing protein [Saccharospirillum sp.]
MTQPDASPPVMPDRVPVFPLGALLLPSATLPLQIFEPRYLMMVSRCTREDTGFVVSLSDPKHSATLYGCYGRIIDFGHLDNGLLGITVLGEHRVRVSGMSKDDAGLWWGDATPLAESPVQAVEEQGWLDHYQPVLDALLQHPYLVSQPGTDLDNPRAGVHQLMVWLPLEIRSRMALLFEDNFLQRCRLLDAMLSELAGQQTPPENFPSGRPAD